MNFSLNEIDGMTTHESTYYINKFKENKLKEKEAVDKLKSNMQNKRISRQGRIRRRGGK